MKRFVQFFSLPKILAVILIFSLAFGSFVPLIVKETFYAISLTLKSGLIFVLPAIIFSYVFSTIASIERKSAAFLIVFILTFQCLSVFFGTMLAYSVGRIVSTQDWMISGLKISTSNTLNPLWELSLPSWLPNERALLLGLFSGILLQAFPTPSARKLSQTLKKGADFFLNRLFIPVVPVFVLGFALKLQHEGTLSIIAQNYGPIFVLFTGVEAIYIFLLYFLGAGLNFKKATQMIQTAFPSILSGFSIMSSAGSMPLTLLAAEKNTGKPELTKVIVPMTVNTHLVGDTFFICLMGLIFAATSSGTSHFQGAFPTIVEYLPYSCFFVLAMFAVAAVPGGGIIVMLPILEKYLGLSPDILSLMTTLYILFDPFNTAANVAANGASAVILSKLFSRVSRPVVALREPQGV